MTISVDEFVNQTVLNQQYGRDLNGIRDELQSIRDLIDNSNV